MDILSGTVAALRTGTPASGLFVRHAPWGREYPVVPGVGFHIVVEGACWLSAPGVNPMRLATGDVLFMPRGTAHVVADDPDTPVSEVAKVGEPREIPGPGARTTLLCGAYEMCRARSHPLLDQLPDFLHLPADSGRSPDLRAAVDLLLGELTRPRPGSDAAVPALLDTLLLFILRSWYDRQPDNSGWAGAFADSAVSAALRAIHDEPARAWTVPALSALAGVSRATLARRFTTTVGEAPLSYLTRWRMLTAARLLRETDLPIAAIAHRVGYGSEFAFAKAFKREFAVAPGRYRHAEEPTPVLAV
ncbi:AraC family transcriptional regulator [Nocardia spumae]|uniref:AraC family transcriptional regulator n=1 Tax=Nocardia spumae TaxID=2887190 RepID=UPI001D1350C9|nr:AraC family transcriptional regulator [Nocardia spumae]